MTKETQDTPSPRFDEALTELERLVEQLERGDLTLEAALATFENGVALVRRLTEALSAAEARVEVLTRDGDGTLRRTLLPGGSDTDA